MARIRSIKPEFFRNEDLQDLEKSHPELHPMLVFAALWGHCDKQGIFKARPRVLQLDILPFLWKDTEGKQLGASLVLLWEAKMIEFRESEGNLYGIIPTFQSHQRISGKEAQEAPKYTEILGAALVKERGSIREALGITGREGKGSKPKDIEDGSRPLPFVSPSLEEVAAYISTSGYQVDATKWMDHYQANGWRVGKNPMKDWKAAVRTWNGNGVKQKQSSFVDELEEF